MVAEAIQADCCCCLLLSRLPRYVPSVTSWQELTNRRRWCSTVVHFSTSLRCFHTRSQKSTRSGQR